MDYPLENLGPERFQQMCQALLAKEFPRVQCFPVAQPDGGRDAVSYYPEGSGDKFMVFQVKYARKPLAETEPHKWLAAIVEDEAPKVRELIPRGAVRYVLMTNVPGTAHLDKGSIDRLNSLLTDKLGVPSSCWWRDDIGRRLDDAWDLKWAYPDIMAGPDFLRAIIESGLSEHRERRASAVRAFLRAQYDMDEEVRFKQVELQNKLLDLFIDVPIALRDQQADRQTHHIFQGVVRRVMSRRDLEVEDSDVEVQAALFEPGVRWHVQQEEPLGAAALLLSAPMQRRLPRVVIEGAPGQGKSTIAQYVCQVHRMRLLGEVDALMSLPPEHRDAPVRLPIKVDLRDFALWLARKDPFNVEQADAEPANWNRSLDSFLAALISHQSGGTQFTTDDLLATLRISATLVVFDGLDEVADMGRRHEVVEEIVRGVQRLEANAASMQAIVTSRPAAFANSPGMPHAKYPYLQLLSLNRSLIMDYAERWLRARHLDSKQGAEFRAVLKDKLDQPHLRDLARNPMQLAILLSLVHTRGASLPDKRTALYDYYIDLFFSREAEKSPLVRNHRELLIDIHRHLAWLLHSEAEQGDTRASVPQERLQQMVAEYLGKEGHDPGLARELFTGMVERVVALVSRVEGTFEFEVQPLREYFAACHLYYTAPQSSPGKEKPGSKPDRFDAIARNFYWLNVTRFYAGCYSKGELPSLVERLQDLTNESGFRIISFPRMLAATLLGDWVFTQNPKSVQQAVDLVLDPAALRYVLAPSETRRHRAGVQNALVLPPRCGREELIKRCFQMLAASPPRDLAFQLLDLLKANSESKSDVMRSWIEQVKAAAPENRLRWLDHGVQLGTLSTLEPGELAHLMSDLNLQAEPAALAALFRARRLDFLHSSEVVFDNVITQILDREVSAQPSRRIESPLDALSHAVDGGRYSLAFRDRQPISLENHLEGRNRAARLTWSSQLVTNTESYAGHRLCVEFARVAEKESQRSTIEWATDLTPWDNVIEVGRELWGDRWALLNLANIAAGIRSTSDKCTDCPELLDTSRSLARRIRFARLRSGAHKWWKGQLAAASSDCEISFALLVALTWTTAPNILVNAELVDVLLSRLDERSWHRLFAAVRRCAGVARVQEEASEALSSKALPRCMSQRLASLLADRVDFGSSRLLCKRYIEGRPTEDTVVLEFALREALDVQNFGKAPWAPQLEVVKRCYELGVVFEPYAFRRQRSPGEPSPVPLGIAQEILSTPDHFPSFLLAIAEERCRQDVSSKVVPVATIAEREGWFSASS
jgi:hypothetical protein